MQQWTTALRFEIGFDRLCRADQVFRTVCEHAAQVVLASESNSWEGDPARWYALFSLPGLLRTSSPTPRVAASNYVLPGGDKEEDRFTLSWAALQLAQINSRKLFQAVADQERGGFPAVRGQEPWGIRGRVPGTPGGDPGGRDAHPSRRAGWEDAARS